MTDQIQPHESQTKMPVPQSNQSEQSFSQGIQLQVIVTENESSARTKASRSPASMRKPVTRAQDPTSSDTIIAADQYGKLKLNQCKDFRIVPPHMNNENLYGLSSKVTHHPPTCFATAEKTENKTFCWDSKYLSQTFGRLTLKYHLDRIWEYIKWPMLFILLCFLTGLIAYACVNSVNTKPLVPKGLNLSTSQDCLVPPKENLTELDTNSSKVYENSLEFSSQNEQSEDDFLNEGVTEAILKGSTTLLRPVIVSQNGFKNNYKVIERNPNQVSGGVSKTSTTKKRPQEQQPFGRAMIKNKAEAINVLAFTSGHQNNFGVPIEEDERILRLLNEELIKLEQKTEPSSAVSRTENSVIVSPTVPQIFRELVESSTSSDEGNTDEIQCQSTSLPMCRGILQYDLTSSKAKNLYLSPSELAEYEQLFASNCSVRAAEFVCSALEPECRLTQTGSLQPCKRICKSILEACSSSIENSDVLTYTFDCDKYPDSDNRNVCEDPTRRTSCYENEFKCDDLSCIPNQWQCDNIKDCSNGEDELGCLICNPEEFRCRSNEKCLAENYRCDGNEDCSDGSDEHDCISTNDESDTEMYPRMFSFASFLLPNYTSENSFTATSDEDRVASGSELNESITVKQVEPISGIVNIAKNLANFQDSKEIMMTSDSENKLKVAHATNSTASGSSSSSEKPMACVDDQLRCVSGKCITVDQLCDKIMDCPQGEDELMCAYHERP